MVYDTLAFDSGAPFELILLKATEIEAEVHKEYRGGSGLYLKATQTLFFGENLGHPLDIDETPLAQPYLRGNRCRIQSTINH
ncbi:hypothetical protein B0H14DRAFT_3459020 [Mycena olivaceomarginata]|nr:hypothetical protein B0H14DRAFT_3459020 [Mycena olivaceomarginata]